MRIVILGTIFGIFSWAICPIVSDRVEPFDTMMGHLIGQFVMLIWLVYIGYSCHSFKSVALGVLGIYLGQVVYAFILNPAWILLGVFTILSLCVIPALGGFIAAGIRKYLFNGKNGNQSNQKIKRTN